MDVFTALFVCVALSQLVGRGRNADQFGASDRYVSRGDMSQDARDACCRRTRWVCTSAPEQVAGQGVEYNDLVCYCIEGGRDGGPSSEPR